MSHISQVCIGELQEFADSRGIIIGICSADPLADASPILANQRTPFVCGDIELRIDPRLTMPEAASIVVVGLGYAKSAEYPGGDVGIISQMAIGYDYHLSLKDILEEMVGVMKKNHEFQYRICIDNWPLVERSLAVRAGIGFFGKNHAVVSPILGSLFNIGCIITDLVYLDPPRDSVDTNGCGGCRECIKACPTKALSEDGLYEYSKCISYLTQKKGDLNNEQIKMIGEHIYGCDICQNVCPYNRNIPRQMVSPNDLYPRLLDILELTNESFAKIYGGTAMGWRGLAVLKRNAAIALKSKLDMRRQK